MFFIKNAFCFSLGIFMLMVATAVSAEPDESTIDVEAGIVWVVGAEGDPAVRVLSQPSRRARILRNINPGDEVEVVRREGSYSLIKVLDQGRMKRGWVLSTQLRSTPPAQVKVKQLQMEVSALKKRIEFLSNSGDGAVQRLAQLQSDLQKSRQSAKKLANDYAKLRASSDNISKIIKENAQLKKNYAAKDATINKLKEQNQNLQDFELLYWALAGAGVMLLGILFGVFLPKFVGNRSHRWV